MQVRGQRFDVRQQARREAYAAFFGTVQDTRNAVAHARAALITYVRHPGVAVAEDPSAASSAVNEALKRLWYQHSLLRLSVSPLERMSTDSLVEQVTGLVGNFDEWWRAALRGDSSAEELDERVRARSDELREVIEHVMDQARTALDSDPGVDLPRRSRWGRLRSRYLDWRIRNVLSE